MATHPLSAAEIARFVHGALVDAPSCTPLLVLVSEDDGGVSFLVPPPDQVEGLDLLDQALGLVAPPDCGAVAMAGVGRALPEEGAALDVVVAHALLRSGSSATYLTDPDGGPLLVEVAEGGLVPDLCRRVLGLPTDPPAQETGTYLSRLWLDRLLETAAARPGALRSEEAAALHPAEGELPFDPVRSWLQLALATYRFQVAVPWAVLRRRFATSAEDRVSVAAGWFDDGSFSRWMLSRLPGADDALAALAELLPEAVHREVVATVSLAAELAEVDDDALADDGHHGDELGYGYEDELEWPLLDDGDAGWA